VTKEGSSIPPPTPKQMRIKMNIISATKEGGKTIKIHNPKQETTQKKRNELQLKSLTQKNMFRLSSIIFSILLFRSLVKI